jgi:hypothetical protein
VQCSQVQCSGITQACTTNVHIMSGTVTCRVEEASHFLGVCGDLFIVCIELGGLIEVLTCVCVYACVCKYVRVCVYVSECVCVCVYASECVYVCVRERE